MTLTPVRRRDLMLGGGALMAAPAGSPGLPAGLRFDVMRDGRRIGSHSLDFRQDGDTLLASIDLKIVFSIGPIVLYRYTHTALETWRNGDFLSLRSATDDDGTRHRVDASRTADNVVVDTSGTGRAVLAIGSIPLTHWNILCMSRPLFSPEDGMPIASRVVTVGEDTVSLVDGSTVRTTHYSLAGKLAVDDWYDGAQVWTALRAAARDGSTIDYRRDVR
jgi:hypothetical protein